MVGFQGVEEATQRQIITAHQPVVVVDKDAIEQETQIVYSTGDTFAVSRGLWIPVHLHHSALVREVQRLDHFNYFLGRQDPVDRIQEGL